MASGGSGIVRPSEPFRVSVFEVRPLPLCVGFDDCGMP